MRNEKSNLDAEYEIIPEPLEEDYCILEEKSWEEKKAKDEDLINELNFDLQSGVLNLQQSKNQIREFDLKNNNYEKGKELNSKKTNRKSHKKYYFIMALVIFFGSSIGIGIKFAESLFPNNNSIIMLENTAKHGNINQEDLVGPIEKIAEKYTPAVASISGVGKVQDWMGFSRNAKSEGTGIVFSITKDKIFLLTNRHVINKMDKINIHFSEKISVEAKFVGADKLTDLAVLKVDKKLVPKSFMKTLVPITFADSDKIRLGERVVAIGNPLGYDDTVTDGLISGLNRKIQNDMDVEFIQTSAAINNGNSGGALFNLKGELIGVNTIKIKDVGVEGIGFAVPSNVVKNTVKEITENGKVHRPYIGIQYFIMDDNIREQFDIPNDVDGVFVQKITRNSPAHKGGLIPGDVISKINGMKISEKNTLKDVVQKLKVGDTIKLNVYRADEGEIMLAIKIEQLPN